VSDSTPSNRVLDWRAHWLHMANTVARLRTAAMNGSAAIGGDAACFQFTLGNIVDDVDDVNSGLFR